MSEIDERRILSRIEIWNGIEVFPLTEAESFYYRQHVVKKGFAFVCMKSRGLPTRGFFRASHSAPLSGMGLYGDIDLDAGPCEAIQVEVSHMEYPLRVSRLEQPKFTAGILSLKPFKDQVDYASAYIGFHKPWAVPYWQAKAWLSAGFSLPMPHSSRRRLKDSGDKLFVEESSVTDALSDKHKMLMVLSLLHPTWTKYDTELKERVLDTKNTGIKKKLSGSDLKNYCAEAGLEPFSKSQLIKRIISIVKASDKHFRLNPDAQFDMELENVSRLRRSISIRLPQRITPEIEREMQRKEEAIRLERRAILEELDLDT